MSSGRIITIPIDFKDYLKDLNWWDEKIAAVYVQLINLIIDTVQCQTTLSGQQTFFIISENEEKINLYLHEMIGEECAIEMCIERVRGHTYKCCTFNWSHI